MQRNVWSDIVSWQTTRLNNSTKYLLPVSMTTTSKKKKWNLLENCHKYAPKLFWNAYTWHELEDLRFYGQWTNLHDRLQNGPKPETNAWIVWYLTSITHVNTNSIVMWVTLQNNAGWDCFKTPILQGILKTQNLLRAEHCALWSQTFVPISWMCKKQTSVSHSSTESEIISLDAGLRLDGVPALDLWDLNVLVLGNTTQNHDWTWQPVVCRDTSHEPRQRSRGMSTFWIMLTVFPRMSKFQDDYQRSKSHKETCFTDPQSCPWLVIRPNQFGPKKPNQVHGHKNQLADMLTKGNFTRDEWNHLLSLFNISHFSSTVCSAAMAKRIQQESGEERVTAKSRPMMNLTARMPSVVSSELLLIGCSIESIWTPNSKLNTLTPINQLADILTNGNFTRDEWSHLLCLFNISHFSSTKCLEVMSKRTQEDASEERVTANSKSMMNLVSRCSVRNPNVLASTASESPGKTRYESQIPLSSWTEQQPRTGRPVKDA